MIPNKIKVVSEGSTAEGTPFMLTFKMREKNNFTYLGFLDRAGKFEIGRKELLASFDQDRNFFLMDYADPDASFTGQVTVRLLTKAEIGAALKAYQTFKKNCRFPAQYFEKLTKALSLIPDAGCVMKVEQL